MVRSLLRVAAVLLALSPVAVRAADNSWATATLADPAHIPGQMFGSGGATLGTQDVPVFNSTVSLFSGLNGSLTHAASFATSSLDVQPGATVGYVFREDILPGWLGHRQRISLSAAGDTGTWTASSSAPVSTGTGISIASVAGGVPLINASTVGNFPLSEYLKITRSGADLALRAASDIAIGPRLTLSPAFGIFGGTTKDDYRFTDVFYNSVSNGTAVPGFVNERVESNSVGGEVGAGLSLEMMPGLAANAGAMLGLSTVDAKLDGNDCFQNAFLTAPCTPGGTPGVRSNVANAASATNTSLGATIGLSWTWSTITCSIGGFVRYDSQVPGVANPQALQQSPGLTTGPARVTFSDATALGGFLQFSMPFGPSS
jgi:hypothetical protein